MTKLIVATFALWQACLCLADIAITDVTARQRYPWNGKVDISYTVSGDVSGARADGLVTSLKVTAVDGTTGVTNIATTLSGDVSLDAGTHKIVWDMNAQGLTFKSTNAVFSVFCETDVSLLGYIDRRIASTAITNGGARAYADSGFIPTGSGIDIVHYTADAGRTDAEKAQARTNIGAADNAEIFGFTSSKTTSCTAGSHIIATKNTSVKLYWPVSPGTVVRLKMTGIQGILDSTLNVGFRMFDVDGVNLGSSSIPYSDMLAGKDLRIPTTYASSVAYIGLHVAGNAVIGSGDVVLEVTSSFGTLSDRISKSSIASTNYTDSTFAQVPATATSIANSRIDDKVADWAMKGQPQPTGTITDVHTNGASAVVGGVANIVMPNYDEYIQSIRPWNDKNYNMACISGFLSKYANKTCDDFNQLNVVVCGDSIMGRQCGTEMSYTPDCNNPSESRHGYQTGHFPPNMWQQTIPYKLLQQLQWGSADVKYYNSVSSPSSEIVKTGSWTTNTTVGADHLYASYTTQNDASITLSFSAAKFVKLIYTMYGRYTDTAASKVVDIAFSDDNGTNWHTPDYFGLTSNLENNGTAGRYTLSDVNLKFGNVVFGNLDATKTYKMRVTSVGAERLSVWGFETWSNPRVNVIVAAEGGNTAGTQVANPQRFGAPNYNAQLLIVEMPYFNDCDVTGWNQNYGTSWITPFAATNSTPSTNQWYVASQTGVYTNFGNIVLGKYDYVHWDGTSWKLGNPNMESKYATYRTDMNAFCEMLASVGTPTLTILPHDVSYLDEYRTTYVMQAKPIMRAALSKYGFANVDVAYLQRKKNLLRCVTSDKPPHLNDRGVSLYMDAIGDLFTTPYDKVIYCVGGFKPHRHNGTGTAGGTTSFGVWFSKIPKVRVFNNSSVTVTDVSISGFTTSGGGAFEYEAFVEE